MRLMLTLRLKIVYTIPDLMMALEAVAAEGAKALIIIHRT